MVEYGATKYGFEPAGEGITVPPPTLVDETTNKDGTLNPEYADQYYEQAPAPLRPQASIKPRPQLVLENFPQPQQQIQYQPAPKAPSPVPQRAQIAGAIQNIEYVPQTRPPAATRTFQPALRPQVQPQTFSYASPAPIQEEEEIQTPRPKITYAQPALRPQPQTTFRFADPAPVQQFAPAPRPVPVQQFAPAPQPAPVQRPAPQFAPQPQRAPAGRGGILDQLSKDYALPSGGAAPLHDISFGYY